MDSNTQHVVLDPFCYPAFEQKEDGTPASIDFDKEEFTRKVNEFYSGKYATVYLVS